MSSSPKVLAIRAYIDKLNNNDVDGAYQYVTDGFVYEAESKPPGDLAEGYGDEAGFNQVSFKAYHEKLSRHITFKTTIEHITENSETGKVIVRVKTKYQQIVTESSSTPPYTGERPSTVEYEFVGDKISKVKVMGDHSFPADFPV